MNRRKLGEEKYKDKFYSLGLGKYFDFIGRDWDSDHGRKIFVKCKTCGEIFSVWNDVLKGKQDVMRCKICGASSDGTFVFSRTPKFEEMRIFYESGHSVLETAKEFNTDKNHINDYAKRYKWHNGRTFGIDNDNEKRVKAAEGRNAKILNQLGFRYIDGYEGKESTLQIKCKKCGTIRAIRADGITENLRCLECQKRKTAAFQEQKKQTEAIERMWQSLVKKGERAKQKAEVKAAKQAELNEKKYICSICGKKFSAADYMKSTGVTQFHRDTKYCSEECRRKAYNRHIAECKKQKGYNDQNFTHRARYYGVDYVTGWDWKRVAKRDGLRCGICGGMCNPDDYKLITVNGQQQKIVGPDYPTLDHIIAMADGGTHTPDNFQIAHHICNSKKGARHCGRPRKEEVNE